MIWYSTLCAKAKAMIQRNYPRLTPPREHANATTKAYAKPRDWSVNGGDTNRAWFKTNETASVDSQGDGV